MKKYTPLLVIALLIVSFLQAQTDTLSIKTKKTDLAEHLLQRSKHQRTTGLVLLLGGIAFDAFAIANYPKDYDFIFGTTPEKDGKATVSSIFFIVGTGMFIASIPVLISGLVNKHKASILLRAENVKFTPQTSTNSWQLKTGIAISF